MLQSINGSLSEQALWPVPSRTGNQALAARPDYSQSRVSSGSSGQRDAHGAADPSQSEPLQFLEADNQTFAARAATMGLPGATLSLNLFDGGEKIAR